MKKKIYYYVLIILIVFLSSCSFKEEKSAEYSSGKYTLSKDGDKTVASQPWVVNIEKDSEKDFVVLNLTDIQLGTNSYFTYWDEVSKMIDTLVEQSSPDMIMITGDISYGCGPAFVGICSYINNYGIPWAPVFGNHDCENSGMSPDMQVKILEGFDNCIFRRGPENLAVDNENGYEQQGNYVVNIVSNNKVLRSFVLINSGTSGVSEIQRKWYLDCASSVQNSKVAVVMHIPTDGYFEAVISGEKLFGVQHEGIASCDSVPFRTYAEETGNTDYFLCGHDHCNCTCIKNNGITYVFSLKTGPGCYFEKEMQGGTKLAISNDGTIVTEHLYY